VNRLARGKVDDAQRRTDGGVQPPTTNVPQNPAQAALLFLKDFPGFAHNNAGFGFDAITLGVSVLTWADVMVKMSAAFS
jgi:hypothetical protein